MLPMLKSCTSDSTAPVCAITRWLSLLFIANPPNVRAACALPSSSPVRRRCTNGSSTCSQATCNLLFLWLALCSAFDCCLFLSSIISKRSSICFSSTRISPYCLSDCTARSPMSLMKSVNTLRSSSLRWNRSVSSFSRSTPTSCSMCAVNAKQASGMFWKHRAMRFSALEASSFCRFVLLLPKRLVRATSSPSCKARLKLLSIYSMASLVWAEHPACGSSDLSSLKRSKMNVRLSSSSTRISSVGLG
mmetsp:Transcript_44400/g.84913  ORF Transcript_44400/g.84913 Transcript_44400/m.84913 type:complete len:247 (-) Transcript_44400:265-1005(-)